MENENKKKKKIILVVDDNDMNRLYLFEILRDCCVVIQARNGQEAVDECTNNHPIDLVLMDIRMPIMSGNEAAKIIRKLRPGLRIIAITANMPDQDYDGIFDEVLYKPVLRNHLFPFLQ